MYITVEKLVERKMLAISTGVLRSRWCGKCEQVINDWLKASEIMDPSAVIKVRTRGNALHLWHPKEIHPRHVTGAGGNRNHELQLSFIAIQGRNKSVMTVCVLTFHCLVKWTWFRGRAPTLQHPLSISIKILYPPVTRHGPLQRYRGHHARGQDIPIW